MKAVFTTNKDFPSISKASTVFKREGKKINLRKEWKSGYSKIEVLFLQCLLLLCFLSKWLHPFPFPALSVCFCSLLVSFLIVSFLLLSVSPFLCSKWWAVRIKDWGGAKNHEEETQNIIGAFLFTIWALSSKLAFWNLFVTLPSHSGNPSNAE